MIRRFVFPCAFAALAVAAFSGASCRPPHPPRPEWSAEAIKINRGEYILTSTRRLEVGDVYSPKQGLVVGRNLVRELQGLCGSQNLELPASQDRSSYSRHAGRSAAAQLAVQLGLDAEAGFSHIESAYVSVSSFSRRALDFSRLTGCIRSLPEGSRESVRGAVPPGGEIVTDVISGSYTVRFVYDSSAGASAAQVARASFTWSNDYDQSGDGPALFHAEPLGGAGNALQVQPENVWFHDAEVVKAVRIRESLGAPAAWTLHPLEFSGGFICYPGEGRLAGGETGRLYVVRLPMALFEDTRSLSSEGAGEEIDFDIHAGTVSIPLESYAAYERLPEDPPEIGELLKAVHAHYNGDFQGAHEAFERLARAHPYLEREQAFSQLHEETGNALRHSSKRRKALESLHRYVSSGFGRRRPGTDLLGGGPPPQEAVELIRQDPQFLDLLYQDRLLHAAIATSPRLKAELGIKRKP